MSKKVSAQIAPEATIEATTDEELLGNTLVNTTTAQPVMGEAPKQKNWKPILKRVGTAVALVGAGAGLFFLGKKSAVAKEAEWIDADFVETVDLGE